MKKGNRIIGTESYVNTNTGEIVNMQIMETDVAEKDTNFHKLFLGSFVSTLELIGNQKTKLFCWIITNTTKDNLLLYSYRQISDKTGISYRTVADTMKNLQDTDFLRKHSSGYYIINPNIIFKGSYQRRCIALKNYAEAEQGEKMLSEEKRLKDIEKSISKLQREEQKIRKKIDLEKALGEMN